MFVDMKTENNDKRLEIRISETLKNDLEKYLKKRKLDRRSSEFLRTLISEKIYQ